MKARSGRERARPDIDPHPYVAGLQSRGLAGDAARAVVRAAGICDTPAPDVVAVATIMTISGPASPITLAPLDTVRTDPALTSTAVAPTATAPTAVARLSARAGGGRPDRSATCVA